MAQSNKKYLLLHDIIVKINRTKLYGVKEIELLHWRFTEFQDHYNENEENIKELLECYCKYIDIILKYSETSNFNSNVEFKSNIARYMGVIGEMGFASKIANSFVEEKTTRIFEHVTDPSIKTICAKELIRAYNQVIKYADMSIREKLIDSGCTIHLYKLTDILCACGDYEYQTYLLETIFRVCPNDLIKEHANAFFPETESLQHAFVRINIKEFDSALRIFLNVVNCLHRNIYSFIVNNILLDEVDVTPPMIGSDKKEELWIDFNVGTNTIGIYCDQLSLRSDPLSQDSEDNGWELITIFEDDVSLVEIKKPKSPRKEKNVPTMFRFTLANQFHVKYPGSAKVTTSKFLKVVVFDNKVIEELQNSVLPKMFKDKFKGYHSQKNLGTNDSSSMEMDSFKGSYKPLTCYHRKKRTNSRSMSIDTRSTKSLEDLLKVRKSRRSKTDVDTNKNIFVGGPCKSPDSPSNNIDFIPETQYFSAEEDSKETGTTSKSVVDDNKSDAAESKFERSTKEKIKIVPKIMYQSKPMSHTEKTESVIDTNVKCQNKIIQSESLSQINAIESSIDKPKGRTVKEKIKFNFHIIRQGISVRRKSFDPLFSPILETSETNRSEQNSCVQRDLDNELRKTHLDHCSDENDITQYVLPEIISTQVLSDYSGLKINKSVNLSQKNEVKETLKSSSEITSTQALTVNSIELDINKSGKAKLSQGKRVAKLSKSVDVENESLELPSPEIIFTQVSAAKHFQEKEVKTTSVQCIENEQQRQIATSESLNISQPKTDIQQEKSLQNIDANDNDEYQNICANILNEIEEELDTNQWCQSPLMNDSDPEVFADQISDVDIGDVDVEEVEFRGFENEGDKVAKIDVESVSNLQGSESHLKENRRTQDKELNMLEGRVVDEINSQKLESCSTRKENFKILQALSSKPIKQEENEDKVSANSSQYRKLNIAKGKSEIISLFQEPIENKHQEGSSKLTRRSRRKSRPNNEDTRANQNDEILKTVSQEKLSAVKNANIREKDVTMLPKNITTNSQEAEIRTTRNRKAKMSPSLKLIVPKEGEDEVSIGAISRNYIVEDKYEERSSKLSRSNPPNNADTENITNKNDVRIITSRKKSILQKENIKHSKKTQKNKKELHSEEYTQNSNKQNIENSNNKNTEQSVNSSVIRLPTPPAVLIDLTNFSDSTTRTQVTPKYDLKENNNKDLLIVFEGVSNNLPKNNPKNMNNLAEITVNEDSTETGDITWFDENTSNIDNDKDINDNIPRGGSKNDGELKDNVDEYKREFSENQIDLKENIFPQTPILQIDNEKKICLDLVDLTAISDSDMSTEVICSTDTLKKKQVMKFKNQMQQRYQKFTEGNDKNNATENLENSQKIEKDNQKHIETKDKKHEILKVEIKTNDNKANLSDEKNIEKVAKEENLDNQRQQPNLERGSVFEKGEIDQFIVSQNMLFDKLLVSDSKNEKNGQNRIGQVKQSQEASNKTPAISKKKSSQQISTAESVKSNSQKESRSKNKKYEDELCLEGVGTLFEMEQKEINKDLSDKKTILNQNSTVHVKQTHEISNKVPAISKKKSSQQNSISELNTEGVKSNFQKQSRSKKKKYVDELCLEGVGTLFEIEQKGINKDLGDEKTLDQNFNEDVNQSKKLELKKAEEQRLNVTRKSRSKSKKNLEIQKLEIEDKPEELVLTKKYDSKKEVVTSKEDNISNVLTKNLCESLEENKKLELSQDKGETPDGKLILSKKLGNKTKIKESQESNASPAAIINLFENFTNQKPEISKEDKGEKLEEKLVFPTRRGRKKNVLSSQEDNCAGAVYRDIIEKHILNENVKLNEQIVKSQDIANSEELEGHANKEQLEVRDVNVSSKYVESETKEKTRNVVEGRETENCMESPAVSECMSPTKTVILKKLLVRRNNILNLNTKANNEDKDYEENKAGRQTRASKRKSLSNDNLEVVNSKKMLLSVENDKVSSSELDSVIGTSQEETNKIKLFNSRNKRLLNTEKMWLNSQSKFDKMEDNVDNRVQSNTTLKQLNNKSAMISYEDKLDIKINTENELKVQLEPKDDLIKTQDNLNNENIINGNLRNSDFNVKSTSPQINIKETILNTKALKENIDDSQKGKASAKDDVIRNDILLETQDKNARMIYDVNTEVVISSSQKSKSSDGKRKLSQSDTQLFVKQTRKRRLMFDPNDLTYLESDITNDTYNKTNEVEEHTFSWNTLLQKDKRKNQRKKRDSLLNESKTIPKKTSSRPRRSRNKRQNENKKTNNSNGKIKLDNVLLNKEATSDTQASLFSDQEKPHIMQKSEQQKNMPHKRVKSSSSSDDEPQRIEVVALVHNEAERNVNKNKINKNTDQKKKVDVRKYKKMKLSTNSDEKLPKNFDTSEIAIIDKHQKTIKTEAKQTTKVTTEENKKATTRKRQSLKKAKNNDNSVTTSRKNQKEKKFDHFLDSFNVDVCLTEEERSRIEMFDTFYGDITRNMNNEKSHSFRKRQREKILNTDRTSRRHTRKSRVSKSRDSEICTENRVELEPKFKILNNVLLKPARTIHAVENKFDVLKAKESEFKTPKEAEESEILQETEPAVFTQKIKTPTDSENRQCPERLWELLVQNHQDLNHILLQFAPNVKKETEIYQTLLKLNSNLLKIVQK